MESLSRVGAFALLAAACLTIMVGCVIVPGIARISAALGVPDAAGWLITLPSLGVVLCGPLAAQVLQRIGLRDGLRLGLLAYGALGAGGMFLSGFWPVMIDRLLLGGATALVMAAGTGLISQFYEGRARLAMIARQGMAIELGGVVFLFAGGILAAWSWHYPFLLYLFAWLVWLLVEWQVPGDAETRLPRTATKQPSGLPRALWMVYAAALLSMIVFFCAVIALPGRLQGLGADEAQTGYFLSFVSLVAVGAAGLMPRCADRWGERPTLALAFVLYAVAHGLFATTDSIALLVLAGVALGGGFGLSVPLVNHLTVERTSDSRRGAMLAYLSMAIFLGQFLASLLEFVPVHGAALFFVPCAMAALSAVLIPRLDSPAATMASATTDN